MSDNKNTFESVAIKIWRFSSLLDVASYEEPLAECKDELRNNFVEIFANQKSSEGDQWPAHSPVTIKLHGDHPLLILSGDLYQELTGDSVMSERRVTAGTDLEYAEWNNDGVPDNNLPQREFMYLTEDTQNACVEHVGDYIFKNMPGEIV